MTCAKHKHSSHLRAVACYEKQMRKHVHRKTRGTRQSIQYLQAAHVPPLEVDCGPVKVVYFYSGLVKCES